MTGTQSKALTYIGWTLSCLVSVMMIFSAAIKVLHLFDVDKQMVDQLGYPLHVIVPIGIVEACCVVTYLFPRTTILGAILLTGYLGGAIATNVRVQENFLGPAIFGIVVWLGVYLRDARLRALIPLRSSATMN